MAKGLTDDRHYQNIANEIRSLATKDSSKNATYPPSEMPQAILEVGKQQFDAGVKAGKAEGGDTEAAYQQGLTDGKQAEYDRFWDAYQDYGNLTDYHSAFRKRSWNDANFRPKYDMKPVGAYGAQMFQQCGITNLAGILDSQGVVLDFSACDSLLQVFQSSAITHIPEIDATNAISLNYTFSCEKLQEIAKLKVSEKSSSYQMTFRNAYQLEKVIIEGTIAASIDLHWSPLTRASLESVMDALSNTTTSMTASFMKTAVEAAFTTDEWNTRVATAKEKNWTITLV